MSDQPDRIRAWNKDTGRMTGPWTIEETIYKIAPILAPINGELDSNPLRHLVFMRNTGIDGHPSKILAHSVSTEIFAEDMVIHATEPWVYRIIQKRGCWWAISLCPEAAMSRPLCNIFRPTIVGNVFENNELVTSGEVI